MPKLHQIIALANGQRTRTQESVTRVYKQVQKEVLFDGLVRTYKPQREDEHELPPEQKNIQAAWNTCLKEAVKHWTKLMNITATQDYANCEARGTVKVDGKVVLPDVPVTHLLFLEKHVVDVRTFLTHLPVLDPAEAWQWDENRGCFITAPQRKIRTRKVPQVLVKYKATEEHPAQTERFDEDIVVGEWETVLMSGRIPAETKTKLLERVDKLIEGIKLAREEANQAATESIELARPLFEFIVDGKIPTAKTE
jgi:hypothetical protein